MNKRFNIVPKMGNLAAQLRSKTARGVAVAGASLLALPAVMAQVTDPFDTAIAEATTKVSAYAAALVTLAAVSVVFWIAIKYVKRIPRAS